MDGKTLDCRKYTWQEVRRHNTATDCWIVIDGKVYNVSKWLKCHPGGALPLLHSAGQDCSSVFKSFHPFSWIREKRLPPFYIGDISEPDNEEAKESVISSELDKIHEEVVKEGGYETYCKCTSSINRLHRRRPAFLINHIFMHIFRPVVCCIIFEIWQIRNTKKALFNNSEGCLQALK
jgi:predicted heme/steroid binding protein